MRTIADDVEGRPCTCYLIPCGRQISVPFATNRISIISPAPAQDGDEEEDDDAEDCRKQYRQRHHRARCAAAAFLELKIYYKMFVIKLILCIAIVFHASSQSLSFSIYDAADLHRSSTPSSSSSSSFKGVVASLIAEAEQLQFMDGDGHLSLSTTTGFLVGGVILVFVFFVVAFFLYLRANRYWGAIPISAHARVLSVEPPRPCGGLEAAAVAALAPPVVVRAGGAKDGLECPVCLSELADGEAARVLPRCGHAFHLDCIDTWFCSHSTCPLCRTPAALPEPGVAARRVERSSASSQEGTSVSSSPGSSPAVLVIEIQAPNSPSPEEVTETSPPPPPPPPPQAETAALRSWRRLLVLGSRMSRVGDVEQGRAPASKAPASS